MSFMCDNGKKARVLRAIFLFVAGFAIFCAPDAVFSQEPPKTDPELEKIQRRADALAPLLSPGANDLIRPITDRAAWERLAKNKHNQSIIVRAEKMLNEPIPVCPEAVYKEYYVNGNRSNAQRALGIRAERLRILAQAELLENKGRFLPALEETIRDFCDYPSWVLPAHDPQNAGNYDRRLVSADLAATHHGAAVSIIRRAMKDVLSPEVADLMAREVQRRVLDPYEKSVRQEIGPGMWWIKAGNNWNSVCHNGTLCAALALYDEPEKRAWYLAAAEVFISEYFFRGFTDDGYCSEGMSYWNYGFGNFTELAEIALRVTDSAVNLFDAPKAAAAAWFAPKMEVAPGFFAAFADCPVFCQPNGTTVSLLSRRLGMGLEKKYSDWPHQIIGAWISTAVNCFPPTDNRFDRLANSVDADAAVWNAIRSEFPDAGIVIERAPLLPGRENQRDTAQLSAVFKGGHNGELHNHNDLGSYCVLAGKSWMILDPGGEKYTRRTFSAARYDGELLNSFGHPVPRIGETLQKTGRQAKAVLLEKSFSDERDFCKFDLTNAYPVDGLVSATRAFEFTRAEPGQPNRFVVTDFAEFAPEEPNVFETALVTFGTWEKISSEQGANAAATEANDQTADDTANAAATESTENIRLSVKSGDDRVDIAIRAADAENRPVLLTLHDALVGENDEQVPKKPTRLGIATAQPVSAVTITVEFTPAE